MLFANAAFVVNASRYLIPTKVTAFATLFTHEVGDYEIAIHITLAYFCAWAFLLHA
jgi:hypothetical protein